MTVESANTPAKRGPKGNLQGTGQLVLTVPDSMRRYIRWLARHSVYGPSEQDVVIKILTRELDAMFTSAYHDRRLPDPDN